MITIGEKQVCGPQVEAAESAYHEANAADLVRRRNEWIEECVDAGVLRAEDLETGRVTLVASLEDGLTVAVPVEVRMNLERGARLTPYYLKSRFPNCNLPSISWRN
jgi:hypothetical protein